MVGLSSVAGVISVLLGMWASFRWDTPAGPSIVVAAMLLFLASIPVGRLQAAR
jgi:zinc transport system permease protein